MPIYRALITAYREIRVSFRYVVTFDMDEYVGLPGKHDESSHSFVHNNFLSQIDIDINNINIFGGNVKLLHQEYAAYKAKIKAVGGIDLLLSGIESDEYIAFTNAGSSLATRTRVKTLAYNTPMANALFYNGGVSSCPRTALTVGVRAIMEAREVVVVATGPRKASTIQKIIEKPVSHLQTLSCLQLHPHCLIVVDEDATLELKVKTVNVRQFLSPGYPRFNI